MNLPEEDDNEGSGANFEKAIETTKQVTDFVIEQYKARLEAEKEYIDASISLQENRVDRAIEIAKLGNSEYLDEEQSRLQKLEREREQSQRRQENVARAQILINLLLGVSRAFADGGNASGATSGIGSILSNLGSIIPSFYKGTERTLGDESSPMFAGRDGHLIFADSSEMIFNGSQVSDLQSVFGRNVTTNQITDYVTSSATNKTNYVTTTTKDIQYEKLISELQVMPRINYEGIIRNVGALQVANYTTNTSNSDNRKIEELLATLIETTKKGQRAQKSGRSFGERWRNG